MLASTNMDSLAAIENRINNIDRMLGQFIENEGKNENLTDSIISANTLISSAINNRPKINETVKRADELEKFLDPMYLDEQSEIKAKEVYINTIAPELAENFEILEEIQKLEGTLGAEYFKNIPDVTDKLKSMNNATSEQMSKNDLLQESLILAMQRYSEIQDGIKNSLNMFNERLDRIEERIQKKQKPDE